MRVPPDFLQFTVAHYLNVVDQARNARLTRKQAQETKARLAALFDVPCRALRSERILNERYSNWDDYEFAPLLQSVFLPEHDDRRVQHVVHWEHVGTPNIDVIEVVAFAGIKWEVTLCVPRPACRHWTFDFLASRMDPSDKQAASVLRSMAEPEQDKIPCLRVSFHTVTVCLVLAEDASVPWPTRDVIFGDHPRELPDQDMDKYVAGLGPHRLGHRFMTIRRRGDKPTPHRSDYERRVIRRMRRLAGVKDGPAGV